MATPEEDYATLDDVEIFDTVSRNVFKQEFKHLKKRLDKQESLSFNIIIGSVGATFLVLIGLAYSTWLFMAGYNESFIETKDVIQGEIQEMRKENFEFKESLLKEEREQKPVLKPAPVTP